MKRRIIMFAQNVDALVPLVLGVAVSVLGLLDVATPHVVDNSILIVLAVLSFALLRDRWNKDSTERDARELSGETLSVIKALQAKTAPLAELDRLVTRMHVTVEGLAAVKTLKGVDIDRAFVEARRHTDRWSFKGGTGTYTQAVRLVLARNAHRLLDLWAPLTCWMMLARGDIDGIVGYRIGEIDLHAGALIAGEAGLAVQDFSGNPFVSRLRDMSSDRSIVAGSSRVVEDLAKMLVTGKRLAEPLGDLMTAEFPER